MNTELLIRESSPEDAEAIATMYQETWPLYWATREEVRLQFEVLAAIEGQVLIAVKGHRVVGHCEFIPTREPPPYGYWGYLEALEVHREFHRQGIGTALVREAIRRCAALGCTSFGTSPDDERSENLYRKVEMTQVERRLVTKFAIPGDVAAPTVEAEEELVGIERPWESLLHILGRFHCAPYWWSTMRHRQDSSDESAGRTFALRVRFATGTCVVLFTNSWLHVFLPPSQATDHALVANAVAYGAHRLRALGSDYFHTLMPLDGFARFGPGLADVVRSVPGIYPSESHFDFHMWMPLVTAQDRRMR